MEDFQERIFHLRPEECHGPMKKGGGAGKAFRAKGTTSAERLDQEEHMWKDQKTGQYGRNIMSKDMENRKSCLAGNAHIRSLAGHTQVFVSFKFGGIVETWSLGALTIP